MTGVGFEPGTYTLQIENAGAANATFNLLISKTGVFPSNGIKSAPQVLTVGTAFAGKIGSNPSTIGGCASPNVSYYMFTVTTAGPYTVQMSGTTNYKTFDLYSNPAFSTSVANALSTTGIPSTTLAAGTYYLKVAANSYSTDSYTLKILAQ